MPITNEEAIRYCNEVIRPLCERYRAEYYRTSAALTTWYNHVSALIPNDTSALEDGREDDGVSRLLGSDINGVVTQMAAFQAQIAASGVLDVISKPCVRSVEVV